MQQASVGEHHVPQRLAERAARDEVDQSTEQVGKLLGELLDVPAEAGARRELVEEVDSSRPVDVPTMLDTVDEDDLLLLVDLIHHPVVAAARRPEPRELADERLPDAPRVRGERAQRKPKGGGANLLWQPVEMSQAFRGDLDLVGHDGLRLVAQAESLPLPCLSLRSADRLHELGIAENVECLLEGLEVVGADEDETWPAVAGHENPLVLLLDSVRELGQVRLGLGEGDGLAHWSEF